MSEPKNAGPATSEPLQLPCTWKGREFVFEETLSAISVHERSGGHLRYHWRKAEIWPDVYAL